MIYTHVLNLGGGAVRSPLDALGGAPGHFAPAAPYAAAPAAAASIGAARGRGASASRTT